MNKWIMILLIIVIGFVFYTNRKEPGYQSISPQEAKERLEGNGDIILLDVRTPEEYRESRIQGSTLIPLNVIQEEIEAKVPDKNQEIMVYCRSGNRSKTAVNQLLKMGYKNVYDLGGIIDWPYGTE